MRRDWSAFGGLIKVLKDNKFEPETMDEARLDAADELDRMSRWVKSLSRDCLDCLHGEPPRSTHRSL